MNVPGPRKQPSVSPPGQFPGQTQIRTHQHFVSRGTTPPVNIRSQTPEAAFEGQQLQYQRIARPPFSSSPTGYTQLGSSQHPQQVTHIAQAPQQQLRAAQPTLHVISADSQGVHSVFIHPGNGQPSHSQQTSQSGTSPRPPTLQLTTQIGQVYPPPIQPGYISAQSSAYPGPLPSQQGQQQLVQPQPQQQQQGSFQSQQAPRYQQSGPQFFHSQRPPTPQQQGHSTAVQVSDGQVNLGLPPNQQTQQVLISQAYTQGSVPHDINKGSLGITAPQRGQTPPQSALQTNIMYNNQPATQPRHQNYGRGTMAGSRQPRPQLSGNTTGVYRPQVYVGMTHMAPQMQIVQPTNAASIQFQYNPAGSQMPQAYPAMTSQTQNLYAYYPTPANNQVYVGSQNQWQQARMMQPTSTQSSGPYQKREKKLIPIIDPKTGETVNLGSMAGTKSSNTPPQSGTSSSRDTPVSSTTPPSQTENDNIKAQFARQVVERLSDKSSQQTGVPPGCPPSAAVQPQMLPVQPAQAAVMMPQQQQQQLPQPQQQLPQQQLPPGQQQAPPVQPQPFPQQQQLPPQHPAVPMMGNLPRSSAPGQNAMAQPNLQPVPPANLAPAQQPAVMVPGAAGPSVQAAPPQPVLAQQQQQAVMHQPQLKQQLHRPPQPQVQQPPQPAPVQLRATPAEEQPVQQLPKPSTPAVEQTVSVPSSSSAVAGSVGEATVSSQKQPAAVPPQKDEANVVQSGRQETSQTNQKPATTVVSEVKPSTTPEPVNGSQPANKEQAAAGTSPETPSDSSPSEVSQIPVDTSELEEDGSKSVPPAVASPPEGKERKKKVSQMRPKDTPAKLEKMDAGDMDASKDSKEPASSAKTPDSATAESSETKSPTGGAAASTDEANTAEAQNASEPSKETSPVTDQTSDAAATAMPTTSAPQDVSVTESKSSDEEQRRVAERNEKNSKEHSKSGESAASEPASNDTISTENIENHVDASESTVEKPESVIKKYKIELKYKYKEDQWSPLNPEGKKHYDRNFLLQLQYSSESLEKPDGLPQLPDVVLDSPVMTRNEKQFGQSQPSNSKGTLDFTPAYVVSNANLKPPIHQRRSQQRGRSGGCPPPKVISLPLQQEVKLHRTKNAWKPNVSEKKEATAEELDELQELLKKVRGILNKLTPQKFQVLLKQVVDLGIDTEAKLAGTIDITFEKAISEPSFSVAYASLCKCLSDLKVPTANNPNEYVVFRKLLLNRCQKEFQKDKSDLLDIEKIQKAIDEADTPEKKKELQEEKELAEQRARQRSLGNIRFIGELFKLKMLTENIMHDCLIKLLNSGDEDSLEALCRLLTTIGKDIDHEKAKDRVDQYFQQLRKTVDCKKTSARVRFMILDVIELRRNNWIPRRDENNPKTIEQIHKEAHEEEQRKKSMIANASMDTKRKPGRGSGSRHSQQGDDGWTPVKPSRQTLDPARMKITKQPMDETIQLGPGGRPGSIGTWGRGSSGGSKVSTKESERPSTPGNRYSLLSGGGGAGSDNYDSGRGSYSRGGVLAPSGRDAKGGRLSQGRDRPKTGARMSQEKERESALAAARNISGPRSASGSRTPVQSRNQSRESSRNRDRSSDMRPPSVTAKELSAGEIERKTKSLMEEYLSVNDLKEALLCIEELESPRNLHVCVAAILNHVLERSPKSRQMTSHLLREAIKRKVITTDHYTNGLQDILEYADDMAIDIPQIWSYLGELIGPMVEDSLWPMSNLKQACRPLLRINKAGVLVAKVLHDASQRLGHIKVGELWRKNKMQWSDFLPPGEDVQKFLRYHKLEYTITDDVPKSPEATTLPMERVQEELERLIDSQCDNEQVFDWINANIADNRTKEPAFIRALMTAVCSSSITREGASYKVDTERLKKRFILLQRFLDHDAKLELQALYALQALIHKLEHPTEVLRIFFDALYDEDIISEDAFYQWESSTDPAEQAGKGVAVTSVVQFFTWLREAEEEEPAAN